MNNTLVETLSKYVSYSIISFAGFLMLYKLFTPAKNVDKTFMTKNKKRAIKNLKYLFYDVKQINFDNLKLVKLAHKNDTVVCSSETLTEKNEKLKKMTNYLENVIKIASVKELENANTEEENKEYQDYGYKKPKTINKLEQRDKLFYQLFQNVSKVYAKNSQN